ncbi:hypothetical protein C6501_08760 [Candidatus Poribacteria bacterium]|nr:MAG: hypothetical protein C6501_08760 [Candidatus Poribacteria bacterium]
MIRYLEVKGLNNKLSQPFEFNEDLNIITGPNGSGKTTLLKLIWYLISGHLEQILSEIPFSSVSIETDTFSLTMVQTKTDEIKLKSEFTGEKPIPKTINIDPKTKVIDRKNIDAVNELEKRIAQTTKSSLFFPTFRRIEGGFSIDSRSSKHTRDAVVQRLINSTTDKLLTAISQLSDDMSTDRHKFIATVSTIDIIKLLPQEYLDIYQEISILQSQVLESISKEIENNPDKDKIGEMPKSASAFLDAIQKVDKETEQLKKPFSVLSELTRKILGYNEILITENLVLGEKPDGLNFEKESDDIAIAEINDAISSDKLSSGEKQMLSYLCYNAFYTNMAVFIDEPELSLHVDWQSLLLPTLLEQSTGNQFFVATHSPFIYTLYPDKEFLLGDTRGYQGET